MLGRLSPIGTETGTPVAGLLSYYQDPTEDFGPNCVPGNDFVLT